jgi:hypothetical protein
LQGKGIRSNPQALFAEVPVSGETLLSVITGIALSAACGFRVFVPMLVMSMAAYAGPPLSLPPGLEWLQSLTGHLPLAPGFDWIGTPLAVKAFGIATICEIAAYYIPWLDHLLDHIASPAAVLAGILVMASSVTGLSPFLHWILAIIAGGATAGVVQGITVGTRASSTATSLGATNWVVSTAEWIGAILLSVLALLLPAIILIVVGAILIFTSRRKKRA